MTAIYHEKTRLLCMISGTRTLLEDSPNPPEEHAPDSLQTNVITLPSLRSPIAQHRVPFEILVNIFSDLLPSPYHLDPSRQRGKNPDWVVVTHVCRYWRAVAYGWAGFWAYLPLESPGWTSTALEASRSAPVYIDAGPTVYGSVVHPRALEIALSGLNRTKQVTVASKDPVGIMRTLDGLRASEAPLLEKLELIWMGHDLEPQRRIPKDVFRGKVPSNLHVLNLINVVVEPTSPVFSASLTHLDIVLLTPLWHNLSQMFDTLSRLPNLEHIALNRGAVLPVWFTGPDPMSTNSMRKISLPKLKLLRLNGDACVVLRILQCIQAPNCETSCIVFAAEREFGGEGFPPPVRWEELPSIASAVSSLYLPKPDFPCTTLNRLVLTSGMDPLFRTVQEMTAFLRHFPNLETLILRFSPWSPLPAHPGSDVAPVYMPHIARLHLWGRYLHVVATASEFISIPPTASRLITIDGGPPPDLAPSAIISTFKSVFQPRTDPASPESASYTRLQVQELLDPYFFGACIVASHPTPVGKGEKPLPARMELNVPLFAMGMLEPVIPHPEIVQTLANLLPWLVRVFPLGRCTTLEVSHLLFEDEPLWAKTFGHLPAVQELRVRPGVLMAGAAARALAHAHARTRSPPSSPSRLSPGVASPPIPIFPDLRELSVDAVDFSDPAFSPKSFGLEGEHRLRGINLYIARSCVPAEALDALRKGLGAGRVRWDGVEDAGAKRVYRSWRCAPKVQQVQAMRAVTVEELPVVHGGPPTGAVISSFTPPT